MSREGHHQPDDDRSFDEEHQTGRRESIMPSQKQRRCWFVVTVTLIVAVQAATPAQAWGQLGHRVISSLRKVQDRPSNAGRTVQGTYAPSEGKEDIAPR